jgi:hypothetical protein
MGTVGAEGDTQQPKVVHRIGDTERNGGSGDEKAR